MTDDDLRTMAAGVTYPANQAYDPVTLEPQGITKKRVEMMERNLPELLDGGDSLLDIGSNKGFVSMFCRDFYRHIDGYERGTHACAIAEAVRDYHAADNVQFHHKAFRQIPIGKCTLPDALARAHGPYDVVYAGSVHHHFVKDALLHGAPLWLPFKKLAALAGKYLILDGPLTFSGDTSLPKWEKQYGWSAGIRDQYTLENHCQWLAPQFELVRDPVPNERGRMSAVFRRVKSNMPIETVTPADIAAFRAKGAFLKANMARDAESVIRLGSRRYKLDKGLQPPGMFLVLNSLPQYFARTEAILVTPGGEPIGDAASWVPGVPLHDTRHIGEHWLTMNNILSAVGVVEIHLKLGDYIYTPKGQWIDVDVDMVNDIDRIALATSYLAMWERAGAKRAFGVGLTRWIVEHLGEEFVFAVALARLCKGRN